ncbi:uncharacterized protein LOC135842058 [Planococcus citri]|uniref:uncharacterized protein LOC135842058 n=1 Tax=Planococcus citri TaxID=170843 RepID=UPI0031F731F6
MITDTTEVDTGPIAGRFSGEDNVIKLNIGKLNILCPYCGAKHFKGENFKNCCHNGKIDANVCPDIRVPDFLKTLITTDNALQKHYLDFIRQYNNAFAFASIAVNRQIFSGKGPFIFKVQGQLYHYVGPLHSSNDEGVAPSFAALFMLDMNTAHEYRSNNENLNRELLLLLETNLRSINPYCELFHTMREVEQQFDVSDYKLLFTTENTFNDVRRYASATSDEIAAAFVTDADGCPSPQFDFFIYSKKQSFAIHRIPHLNPHVDPLSYPLLFPYGDPGWKPGMSHNMIFASDKRVVTTQLQFYCYRFAIRDKFSLLHSSGKLFQQYVVDAYVKVEGSRLAFIRSHQKELRSEKYNVLMDFAITTTNVLGIPVILPSTFLGSPRYMSQCYQDAMSIVAKFGKPDFFVTFTANPHWIEITENINSWEVVANRPDIVARVFHLKLKELLDDITKKEIFGKVLAYFYVIEFQKRGLPHSHILVILHEDFKIRNPQEIDNFVSAEIPNKQETPTLYDVVTKYMLHSPCGELNQKAPCMVDGACIRNFPKDFCEETTECNGFPLYRRRENEPVLVNNRLMDNRWVVPYNPYLSVRYDAHINVEVCASIKSVKYLFKYVYKGYDCAAFSVTSKESDEVKAYLDTRYVSPPEAIWRLYEFPLQERSHSIDRLPIHLPDEQFVYFQQGSEQEALQNASKKTTKLEAWFLLNKSDESARKYKYVNIPEHYWFHNSKWIKRKKKSKTFGRMYMVSIRDRERYFLRVLLLHLNGVQSYIDLLTVDGQQCNSFEEAVIKRNLLATDQEWYNCIQEAMLFQMPRQLRALFAFICLFSEILNPINLWDTFKNSFCEDYLRNFDENVAINMALFDIENIFLTHGKTCIDFQLPTPEMMVETAVDIVDDSILHDYYNSMNNDQKKIIDEIISRIECNRGGLIFVDGPGGTGKTFLYTYLCLYFAAKKKIGATSSMDRNCCDIASKWYYFSFDF